MQEYKHIAKRTSHHTLLKEHHISGCPLFNGVSVYKECLLLIQTFVDILPFNVLMILMEDTSCSRNTMTSDSNCGQVRKLRNTGVM
jgi:hypothetical protein